MTEPELKDRLRSADPSGGEKRPALSPWTISIVSHGLLLLALAYVGVRAARGLPGERSVEVGIALAPREPAEAPLEFEEPRLEEPLADLSAPRLAFDPPDARLEPGSSNDALPELAPRLKVMATAGRPETDDAPMPALQRRTEGPSRTRFFDVESVGNSFVWVVDRSASMSHRDALGLAKREALASLGRLSPSNTFQFIFYHTEYDVLPLGGRQLVAATPENLEAARALIARIAASGGTEHNSALLEAIRLGPEVIYFLTDADMMSERDVQQLTRANHGRKRSATIHAIEFGNGPNISEDKPLRRLAELNDGTYTYVDVLEIRGVGRKAPP